MLVLPSWCRYVVMDPNHPDYGYARTVFTRSSLAPKGDAETIYECYRDGLERDALSAWHIKLSMSDGASVFGGRTSGVHQRFRLDPKSLNDCISGWCAAHQIPLSGMRRVKVVKYLTDTVIPTIEKLGRFFRDSPKSTNVFEGVQAVDGVSVFKIVINCWTRWLTHQAANQSVLDRFPQLLTSLFKLSTGEAVEDVDDSELPPGVKLGEPNVNATGLYKIINCGEFLWFVCVLADYLPIVANLNKLFQGDETDFSVVLEQAPTAAKRIRDQIAKPGECVSKYGEYVQSCLAVGHFKVGQPGHPSRTADWRESQRKLLLSSVARGLEEDIEVAPVLAAIQGVFHIEKWPASMSSQTDEPTRAIMDAYFSPHVKILEEWYCGEDKKYAADTIKNAIETHQINLVNRIVNGRRLYMVDEAERRKTEAAAATKQARKVKANAPQVHPKPVTGMPMPECVRLCIINPVGSDVITDLAHVGAIAPAGAARCERGVSLQGQLKGSLQTTMNQDVLEAMQYIVENAPYPYDDPRWEEFYLAALHIFCDEKQRRVTLDMPPAKLLEGEDPPGWTRDYKWGQTFTDTEKWKKEMERVKKIELDNRRKYQVVTDAMASSTLKLVTGEVVPYIADKGVMTVTEGDRIFHWWKNCGDKGGEANEGSTGWLEATIERKCGNTYECRWWAFYPVDSLEAKHDLTTANYGVDTVHAGECWVFAAAERLAVESAGPAARAAATGAARAARGPQTSDAGVQVEVTDLDAAQ